ncbi:MAG TPA: cell envelope integrity protein TolA [Steroidobacteraceae bacterium]|jgi:colicin import membrane protein|nr:cell envelope integrity protein TolA [Steroidobacteraceae bacterium]
MGERWAPIGLSVLLHGALVGVLVYGYFQFRRPPPPLHALAIDATVVSQSALDAAHRATNPPPPQPAPPAVAPPAVEQPPPPVPTTHQAAAQAEAAQAEKAAKAAAAAQAEAVQEQAAAKRVAERQRAADEAAREAAQEKAAQAKAKAAQELAARKAAVLAQVQAKAAAAAKAQAAASQADLQRSINAEERLDAARANGAMSTWAAQIQARIQRAWIRPPSAHAGLECTLDVTQVPGGDVVNVKLGSCNGDDAVKQSIVDAAYRASPLPAPSDPSLFERNLEVTFRPTD